MGDVAASEGRTVLFVSHNMAAIESLCSRCIYLEHGRGRVRRRHPRRDRALPRRDPKPTSPRWVCTTSSVNRETSAASSAVCVCCRRRDSRSNSVRMGDGVTLIVEVDGLAAIHGSQVGIQIRSQLDQMLMSIGTNQKRARTTSPRHETEEFVFELDRMPLVPGNYTLTVGVWDAETHTPLMVERAASINVIAADIYNSGWAQWQSVVFGEFEWEHRARETPPHLASNGSNGRQRDDASALNVADGAEEARQLNP